MVKNIEFPKNLLKIEFLFLLGQIFPAETVTRVGWMSELSQIPRGLVKQHENDETNGNNQTCLYRNGIN